ncbi:hypothetical protein WOLCODRAFT_155392 [Wolfiporia cocos MD-104 SS10]|uniref:Uncharacterized protein n=1 Tax=Wolfiporia cocos (strain MD-104) TaxID=742152 RepID=A0A2H3IXK8_WOLCO|nr:hypothetical protein WOLCODRAFT_155392 [Wolfiporia cocos MD-104 SS10]
MLYRRNATRERKEESDRKTTPPGARAVQAREPGQGCRRFPGKKGVSALMRALARSRRCPHEMGVWDQQTERRAIVSWAPMIGDRRAVTRFSILQRPWAGLRGAHGCVAGWKQRWRGCRERTRRARTAGPAEFMSQARGVRCPTSLPAIGQLRMIIQDDKREMASLTEKRAQLGPTSGTTW